MTTLDNTACGDPAPTSAERCNCGTHTKQACDLAGACGQTASPSPRVSEQEGERALFEAWALKSGYEQRIIDIRDGEGYAEPHLSDYWGCWKAADAMLAERAK